MPRDPAEVDQIEERRSKVWELRLKGFSVREIGKKLDLTKSTVHNDLEAVRQEVADDTKEAALKYREIELGRLDNLYRKGLEQLGSICDAFDAVPTDAEQPRSKVETVAPLINALRGISERRAKLLGLDGPVEFKGSIDGELSPEAIRLAISAEFSSRATPSDVNSDSGTETEATERTSPAGTSSD